MPFRQSLQGVNLVRLQGDRSPECGRRFAIVGGSSPWRAHAIANGDSSRKPPDVSELLTQTTIETASGAFYLFDFITLYLLGTNFAC